ncbi:MAG: patatin-like phospholipase family protein [Methylocella sp.]
MTISPPPKLKSHLAKERPPFERIALLLQGGGALGAYQGGVYSALFEANIHPDWVAGISIGAFNSAIIAGNPPEHRVARLREFWEAITAPPFGIPGLKPAAIKGDYAHSLFNQFRAMGILLSGAPGFFKPRLPPPFLSAPGTDEALSYYDVGPLRTTLERVVDFDRINAGATRLSVGATNVRTGNFAYFDTTTHEIRAEHIIASGSLPPGFPPTEIEGEYYWDGGIVSNTPLQWVLDSHPRKDTLAFQVDLWSARGEMPRDLAEVDLRTKEIRFSSRTRQGTDQFRKSQQLRRAASRLLKLLPGERRNDPEWQLLAAEADEKVYNIVHLIYHASSYENSCKDYEFSRLSMEEHWRAGYNDTIRTLRHPEVLQRPANEEGFSAFDLAQDGRE